MPSVLTRRSILRGLITAPFVITTPGLLMPVKSARLASPTIVMGRHYVIRVQQGQSIMILEGWSSKVLTPMVAKLQAAVAQDMLNLDNEYREDLLSA